MSDKINLKDKDPRVPLFGSWRNAYFAVVLIFVFEVVFFYFMSGYFL